MYGSGVLEMIIVAGVGVLFVAAVAIVAAVLTMTARRSAEQQTPTRPDHASVPRRKSDTPA